MDAGPVRCARPAVQNPLRGASGPLRPPPPTTGTREITSVWSPPEIDFVLRSVSGDYDITDAEAQAFGAYLLVFFVGLAGA